MAGPSGASTTTPPLSDPSNNDDSPSAFEEYQRRRPAAVNQLIQSDEDEAPHYADLPPPEPPPDEELPSYEQLDLPTYDDDRLQTPSTIWRICQTSRNLQHVSETTGDRPSYRVVFRSAVFSKKPEMSIHKMAPGADPTTDTSPEVANTGFDRRNKLPWMPRALMSYTDQSTQTRAQSEMAAPNFADWKFKIGDKLYSWNLATRPASLILLDRTSEDVAARFLYSRYGTDAIKGAEVGTLDVYSGYGEAADGSIEWILASCQIAIMHWKGMGRHYKNIPDTSGRSTSISTMSSLSQSLSAAAVYSATASSLGAVGARGGGAGARVL